MCFYNQFIFNEKVFIKKVCPVFQQTPRAWVQTHFLWQRVLATKTRLCLVPDSLHLSDLSCLLESSYLGFDRGNGYCLLLVMQSSICLKLISADALEHTKCAISNCCD